MPFIHPVVFWTGLGAVSVPILIHILNRRRFRVKDWAAMKFLLESIRKNRRRLRIEELILLALRCLAILLAAMVVSRFTGCGRASSAASGSGQGTNVFLLDDSLSMGQKTGVGAIFSAATSDLAAELERIPATAQVAIVEASRASARRPFFGRNFLTDAKALAPRVRALQPADWRASLAEGLAAARAQFGDATAGGRRLYILSDFRRADLTGDDALKAIRQEYAALREMDVEVVALDYGRPTSRNFTIQDVRMLDKFAVAKAPLRLGVTVRNNGSTAGETELRPAARMNTAGGVQKVTLPVQAVPQLRPGESAAVEFSVTCQEAGPAVIEVSLPPDELPGDNTASLALEVRKFIRVLVVDGQRDEVDPSESESFYFCRAVDPRQDGAWGIRTEVIPPQAFSDAAMEDYDAVVLLNVQRLPEDFGVHAVGDSAATKAAAGEGNQPAAATRLVSQAVAALEKYVRGGGGLLVFAGDMVDVNYYNDALWAGGAGLLPYRMGAVIGRGDAESFVRIDPKSIAADRCLQTFQGEGVRFVGLMRFFRYLEAQEASGLAVGDAGAPRVLASFAGEGRASPALAARTFGKGSVLMCYSTASVRWNDWATAADLRLFPPVMMDTVCELARPQRPQTGDVARPILVEAPAGWGDATAVLRPPRFPEQPEVLLGRFDANTGVLQYGPQAPDSPPGMDLLWAGVYEATLSRPGAEDRKTFYSLNADPAEGDLARPGQGLAVSERELEDAARAALAAAFGRDDFAYRAVKGGDTFAQVEASQKREYWKYLAAALLAVLAAETLLAQRFGHYSLDSRAQR
jgi:hypothetical protein